MPCNASYMDPTSMEINLSKVYALLDEVKTGKLKKDWNSGFDPRVYNQGLEQSHLDEKTEELCGKLQKIGPRKLKQFSLELQTWWRDHQEADKERLKSEMKAKRNEKARQKAIEKLTPYERKLLGL